MSPLDRGHLWVTWRLTVLVLAAVVAGLVWPRREAAEEVWMGPPTISLPCGCVWRGAVLERGCPRSEQIREEMDTLRRDGQVRSRDWYDLAIELERDHTPEVG